MSATARITSRFRAFGRLVAMAGWLAACASVHLVHRSFGPSPWPRRLLRGVAWIAGVRVHTIGPRPAARTLIIANHVSWLDIPVLAGATNCAFVAKDALKGHPVMRWLCQENGTVFVDRDRRGSITDQLGAMEAALRSHKALCLFPEGTVGDGRRMLPFRPALLKLAEHPSVPLTVQPVAIDYGVHAPEIGWPQGESGKANFLRLLGRKGNVAVALHFLDPLDPGQDRKRLAASSAAAIAQALSAGALASARV